MPPYESRSLSPLQILQRIAAERLDEHAHGGERGYRHWSPLPGQQTAAYNSGADILFYGGAAGGGKTDLLLGVARREHRRSVIFRRVYTPSLRAVIDRSAEIYGKELRAMHNETLHRWKFPDGRQVRFGSLQFEHDVRSWQGQAHDFYGFDEITEFSESQFRFVTGWNRTTASGQRCRVICTGNPPVDSDGEWVVRFWAPWLDESHPNPAQPGELRWFTTVKGEDIELPNGDPILVEGELVRPRSRTFIPARIQDNPHLVDSGYMATLQGLPEPLRSKLLYGDFRAGREDNAYQVIPSEWVRLAQERWAERPKPSMAMTAIGVDVARGGADKTVIAMRYENWIDELRAYPGASTPDGPAIATLVLQHRRDRASVNVDVIGVGSSVYDTLRGSLGNDVHAMNASEKSEKRDKSGQLGFLNQRAEWWWGLREALDPSSGQDLALPPDAELRADLCAPRWRLSARGIQVESKEDIIKRIGRSPDRGDAVVYSLSAKSIAWAGLLEFARLETERIRTQRASALGLA